jgi:threonyl-tRNA synthetase
MHPIFFQNSVSQTGQEFLKHLIIEKSLIMNTAQSSSASKERIVAMMANGHLKDLSEQIIAGDQIQWVEAGSIEGVEIIRHSMAHVLAQAVQELFPGTQVTIGPVIDNGFYYDFYRADPFCLDDLSTIQERMVQIVDRNLAVQRHVWDRPKAIEFFKELGEDFKVKIIESIPENQALSIYQQGHFYDLCRGPHVASTGVLGHHFALTKLSAAYWRGDQKAESLQRIYGTAWATAADLKSHQERLAEAEKRDHRKLGAAMELFHFQEEAPGSIFWHPKGWSIYQNLQNYMRDVQTYAGYHEVNTPQMVSRTLWEASGHWQKFRHHMYAIHQDETTYAMKPMNCPCHVQIFNHTLKSYRDLPYRMAEFGSCMRHEPSGSRMGIMRVSSFVQDDAHIFCTPDQMITETIDFCRLLFSVYKTLGFEEIVVRFSTRPDVRLGSDEVWDHAEAALRQGAEQAGLNYTVFPGEGAFYGPKLEFALKDSLGRLWQCGTLQADFILPERLDAWYVAADGKKNHPVMLHRVILGSFERFIGVLLEHTGGHLPIWLAPTQAVIVPISEVFAGYAQKIADGLGGLRIHVDARNEKLGYKLRDHLGKKVPYILVVGEKEQSSGTVVVRHKNQQEIMTVADAVNFLKKAADCPEIGEIPEHIA